ncbi:MAG TPA: SDR family NAD(P)-dependent oxidoreductase [Anaerolineae bacterium]|nr:SDR family NAD(P)-dependent oxidoreductase [Anaerolineae bacterium]
MSDMTGKICLVTGANNGIGFETAKGLAAMGAEVVMVCRSKERGEAARAKIEAETGKRPDLLLADLLLQRSVKRVAGEFRAKYDRLDVLVNVAGFAFRPRQETDEGFEKTFALNYLSYFTLVMELIEPLLVATPARIINVASEAHRWDEVDVENLQGERDFPAGPMGPFMPMMYGWSNTYRILFTYELAAKLKRTGVVANCLCPGFVGVWRSSVGFFVNLTSWVVGKVMGAKTPEEGAKTILYLATDPEAGRITGKYFESGVMMESAPQTYDAALQRWLWNKSLALLGYKDAPVVGAVTKWLDEYGGGAY